MAGCSVAGALWLVDLELLKSNQSKTIALITNVLSIYELVMFCDSFEFERAKMWRLIKSPPKV